MKKYISKQKYLPILLEKGQDGFYIAECPPLPGCFTQGKTIDEALKNIREVIDLVLEEKQTKDILAEYNPQELSLHTISI